MSFETQSTKEKIADAAERLFGQQGFPCTSLRDITEEAAVNLAAVNYHFGSKENLYKAVIIRRIRLVNEERLKLLTEAEQLSGDQPVPIRSILETFIRPLIRRATDESAGGVSFLKLISRDLMDPQPFMLADRMKEFAPLVERYTKVLGQTLPNLPMPEVFWRMQFTMGGVLYAAAHQKDFERISCGMCRGGDLDGCLRRLIDFCAAGLEAPVTSLNATAASDSISAAS